MIYEQRGNENSAFNQRLIKILLMRNQVLLKNTDDLKSRELKLNSSNP